MKLIILFGYLATAILSSKRLLQQSQSCPANQVFDSCGSACPAVCGQTGLIACPAVCVADCFCADGFILNQEDGECISDANCLVQQNTCGENEIYTECGSACPPVCGGESDPICITLCVKGCFCKSGFTRNANGECISAAECRDSLTCPRRCKGGFDGCNGCGCDGVGNPTICQQRACFIDEITEAKCGSCELGYELNADTNTCDSAKVTCQSNRDCDRRNGFRCQRDPEWREYSDVRRRDADRVCVTPRRDQDPCNSDRDCNIADGFGCLIGDASPLDDVTFAQIGRCIKYQSP